MFSLSQRQQSTGRQRVPLLSHHRLSNLYISPREPLLPFCVCRFMNGSETGLSEVLIKCFTGSLFVSAQFISQGWRNVLRGGWICNFQRSLLHLKPYFSHLCTNHQAGPLCIYCSALKWIWYLIGQWGDCNRSKKLLAKAYQSFGSPMEKMENVLSQMDCILGRHSLIQPWVILGKILTKLGTETKRWNSVRCNMVKFKIQGICIGRQ